MQSPSCILVPSIVALAAILPPRAASAAPAEDAQAKLPIQRVVLYKHGIGYFERQGEVKDTVSVRLVFKQDQMSDVLKTLTALDRSGGRIGSISYDSQKPPERVLAEFAFDLRQDDVQQSLLKQLRGARIHCDVAGRGEFSGSVLGLDNRIEVKDGRELRTPRLSVMTDGGEIVSADLFDLRSLKFEDESLAKEVLRYLDVLRGMVRRDQKTVELKCEGSGARDVFVSYAVEQPVWKASYRLVVADADTKPFLQGWAIVDNTSEDDWENVQLSLVAGMPVSFRQDLYTPKFKVRPIYEQEEEAVFAVNKLADRDEGFAFDAARPAAAAAPMPKSRRGAPGAEKAELKSFDDAMAEQGSAAQSREIGDLFEYRVDHPVTILRNNSALLPIVSARVDGEKVALYNESIRAANPLSTVRLTNTTGLTLEAGPVTVLEAETYAGESQLASLKPNERRYVSYAVDLGVKASTKYDTESERVHQVQIAHGVMITRYLAIEKKTYSFDNKNDAARRIVVEHPRRPGLQLREPKPAEQELDTYRFQVDVAAKATAKLTVIEAEERSNTYSVTDLDDGMIAMFLDQKVLNSVGEQMLREIVRRKTEIEQLRRQSAQLKDQMNDLSQNQDRIRKNLQALGSSAEEKDLRSTYVAQMKTDEETVKSLKQQIGEVDRQANTKQAELEQFIADFVLEYQV